MTLDKDPELTSTQQLVNVLRVLLDPDNMIANTANVRFFGEKQNTF